MEEVHVQLRRARQSRGLSIEALARTTGVRQAVLASLDAGDLGALPSGLYGRHAVRAYARAVGLDPDAAVAAAAPGLPRLEDPIAALARIHGWSSWTWHAPAPAGQKREPEGGDAGPAALPAVTYAAGLLRLHDWRPIAAAAIDMLLLGAIAAGLAVATAWAAGTQVPEVAKVAAPAWLLIIAVTAIAYFVLLGGSRHETLGARIVPQRRAPAADDRHAEDRSRNGFGDGGELRDRLCF